MRIIERFLGSNLRKFWYFIRKYPTLKKLFWWRFQYKLILKTLENHYHDPDTLIFHTCFEQLERFYEEVKDLKCYDQCVQDILFWREVCRLVYWWKYTYFSRIDPNDIILDIEEKELWHFEPCSDGFTRMVFHKGNPNFKLWEDSCNESWKIEEQYQKEDNRMLKRLINLSIIGKLWI